MARSFCGTRDEAPERNGDEVSIPGLVRGGSGVWTGGSLGQNVPFK